MRWRRKLLQAAMAGFGLATLAACDTADFTGSGDAGPALTLADFDELFGAGGVSRARIGDEILVQNSLTGEQCRVRKIATQNGLSAEDFAVLCAGWKEPSGRLRRFRADQPVDYSALLLDPDLVLWRPGSADCEAEVTKVVGPLQEPIHALECYDSDGWPMLAWTSRGDIDGEQGVYVGYGLPQLATLVEPLLAGDALLLTSGTNSPIAELARAQAEIGGRLITLDDIMNYRQLLSLGLAHNHAGEFSDAVRAYERALELKSQGISGQDEFASPVYAAMGLNLASDGRQTEASLAMDLASDGIEQLTWSDAYPTYLAYKAAVERRFGDISLATALAAQATNERVELFGSDSPTVASARLLEAGIAMDQGQLDDARELLIAAQGSFERNTDPVSLSFAHAARARLERIDGDLPLAAEHGREALRLTREIFGDGANLAAVAMELGAIEADLGNRDAALDAFRQGLIAAERARISQSYISADAIEPYLRTLFEDAAATPAEAPARYDEALQVMDVTRGVTFERAVRRMATRLSTDDPELREVITNLQNNQERLEVTRAALTRLRLGDPSEALGRDEAELLVEVSRLRREISELEVEVQQDHPRYGSLIAPSLADAEGAAALMNDGEAVLRLLLTEQASYAVLVTADGTIAGQRSPTGREQVEYRVAGIRKALTFERGLVPFDLNASHELYAQMLGELDDMIDAAEHLIVIADGALLSLPFDTSVRRPAATEDYLQATWLGRTVAISNLPSLASFRALRLNLSTSNASEAFLGVGDPILGGDIGDTRSAEAVRNAYAACQEGDVYDPVLLNALARLPETADELRTIAGLLRSPEDNLEIGGDAREMRVKDRDLSNYHTISFATHGLLPGEIRCRNEPGLVLTPPDAATPSDDGLLAASEIVSLKLDAELVVLSACNTAGPDGELGGEALSGLAAAFTNAGARRVLASHWDVETTSTVRIMETTFASVAVSPEKGYAYALQTARLRLLRDPTRAHPAFWAPFVLIGDGGGVAVAS